MLLLCCLYVPAEQPTTLHLRGIVRDSRSQRDVSGARVSVAGGLAKQDSHTDSKGFFDLPLLPEVRPGNDVRIRIEKVGYRAYDEVVAVGDVTLQFAINPANRSKKKPSQGVADQAPTITASPANAPPVTTDMRARIKVTKIEFTAEPVCPPESTMPRKQLDEERTIWRGPPPRNEQEERDKQFREQVEKNSYFVNVYYRNVGTLPAIFPVYGRNVGLDLVPVSPPKDDKFLAFWDITYNAAKYPDTWDTSNEFQVGDTVCLNAGKAYGIDKIQSGEAGLWVYVVVKYKDASMSAQQIGVTELAAYFINRLDRYVPAKNHIFLESVTAWRTGSGDTHR